MIYNQYINNNKSRTIVLLNGLTQTTAAWGLMYEGLSQRFNILLLDLHFQGQSNKEGNWKDFDAHASDVLEVIKSKDIAPPILCGISYGSMVAQHFAVNYPTQLSGLVLVSTFAHKTPLFNAIELSWFNALKYGGYKLMLDVMLPHVFSEHYFQNPLIPIDVLKNARMEEMSEQSEFIVKLMTATLHRKDYRQHLQKITVPTLIIQGEKDALLPTYMSDDVHANIKNSSYIILPNLGHTLNLEAPTDLCKLIIAKF
ncbi:MAG: alpha/beta hydrolase [Bacteroidia bacterium]|nr:alpha/beta hydrolase [Bacteroidia bacterium]